MSKRKTYRFIGKLALILYARKVTLPFGALRMVLNVRNLRRYKTNRGVASGVVAAYYFWKKRGDKKTAKAIAQTYTDKKGRTAWD